MITTKQTELDGDQRFQIVFIMGTNVAIVRDRDINDGHGTFGEIEIALDETVTEQNFGQIFAELVEALYRSGKAVAGDRVSCTTYPKGSRIVRASGTA